MISPVAAALLSRQQTAPTAPFVWGDSGQTLTPQQAAADQQIASAMMLQAPVPRTLGEGMDAVGRAILARDLRDKGYAAQAAGLQQANADFQNVMADPSKAIGFMASDPYATDGQKAVAQALMTQQFMATNPQIQAQIANLNSETGKNNATALMLSNGGPSVGNAVQAPDGNFYAQPSYGSTLRPLSFPGAAAPAHVAPVGSPALNVGSVPVPASAGAATGVPVPLAASAPPTGSGTSAPVPVAPNVSAQSGPPAAAPQAASPTTAAVADMTSAPTFMPAGQMGAFATPAQTKFAEANATALGKNIGDAPAAVNTALASSRAVNPLYAAGINNINAALNTLANDNGSIDSMTGLASYLNGVRGTPSYNLGQSLSALKGLSALSTMGNERGASGGSTPIQIRNQQEFSAVAQAVGSIDQGQAKGQLVNSLKSLRAQLQAGMENRAKDIGDLRSLGKLGGGLPVSTEDDPFAGPGVFGLIKAAPDGRPVVTTPQEAAMFPVGTVVIMPSGQPGIVTPQFKAAFGGAAQ